MLTIYSLVNFAAAVAMFSFAFVVYSGNRSEETEAYAYYAAFTGAWALSIGLVLLFPITSPLLGVYALRFSYWAGLCAAISFYFFARTHNEPAVSRTGEKYGFFLLYLILFIGYFFTDAIVRGIEFGSQFYERIPLYRWSGFFVFNGVFSVFTTGAFFTLYKKWRAEIVDLAQRERTKTLFLCGMFAFVPPVVLSVGLPLLDNFRFYWIAPTLSTLWVIATTYNIFRRRVFRLRVVAAELFVVIMAIILFVNIFVP